METTEIPSDNYNFTGMESAKFVSEIFEYDFGGLENIINSSISALNSIFPSVGNNETFSLNKDDILNFDDLDIEKVVTDNAGPIGFVVFSGVLGLVMTIVGLFWCACRCCCRNCCVGKKIIGNRKSQREQNNDAQYDPYNQKGSKPKDQHPCVRYICGTLFVLMALVCFALLVTSLAVNGQMKRGINKLPRHVDNALEDAQTYLNATQKQIEDLLKSNYEILSDKLDPIINDLELVPSIPFSSSNSYEEISNLEKKISGLENDLKFISRVKTNLNSLKSQAGELESGFQVIKQEYHQLLKQCNPEFNQPAECDSLRKHLTAIETLHVEKSFGDNLSNIPDSEWMQELSSELDDAKQYLQHYQGIHADLPIEIIKDQMRNQVKEIGEYLSYTSFTLTDAIGSVIEQVDDVREQLENAESSVQDLSPYVFTSMILICVALICIVAVMSVGVVMIMLDNTGDSSSRFYSDKTGSSLINCGIFTVFITYMFFIVVMIAYFIIAGVGGQLLCEAIDALEDQPTSTKSPILSYGKIISHRFGILPRVGNESDGSFVLPSFTSIITELKNNSGAYKTFNLKTAFNTEELIGLEDQFVSPTLPTPAPTPERHQMVGRLYELADSRDAKFSTADFSNQLNTPITSIDLRGLGRNIGKSNLSQNLNQLQVDILEPMQKNVKTTLQGLESLKFESETGDLASRMRIIAGALLETRLPVEEALVKIKGIVSEFGDFAKGKIDDEVGRSRPLYTAYKYAKDGFCLNIVYPVGGFWLGLSVVLALSIPMLILACVMTGIVNRESKIKGYQKLLFCM